MPETFQDEYWDVDGTSLHRAGWSITSLPGIDMPGLRGNDASYSYRPGNEYRDKVPDARVLSVTMWTIGADVATGIVDDDPKVLLQDNMRSLRQLLRPAGGGQVQLTRRQKYSSGVLTTEALAEVANYYPTMTGRGRVEIGVEFYLADPYFYGTQVVSDDVVTNSATEVVVNTGDDVAAWNNFEFDFVGPLTNPRIQVQHAGGYQVWTRYNGTIANGVTVTCNNQLFTCFDSNDVNRINYITHGGQRYWLGLYPGNNNVTVVSDSGTGHGVIRFKPPYF